MPRAEPTSPRNAAVIRQPTVRGMLLVLVLSVAIAFVVLTVKILFVLFGGLLLAIVLHGSARSVARLAHLRYRVALGLIVLLALGAAVGAGVSIAPTLAEQFEELSHQIPAALHKLTPQARAFLPLAGRTPGKAQKPSDMGVSGGWFEPALAFFGGSVELIGSVFVVVFIAIYVASDPDIYRTSLLAVTPDRQRARIEHMLEHSTVNLARWLWGRLVAMAFVGVTTAISFHFLRVPMAFALGIFAGLLTFVEYAGAVVAAVPPMLLSLANGPSTVLMVGALFTALHVIEGYVLTPLLSRATVRLPPALTLASQVLLGSLTGVLGLTFSTPLVVVAVSAVQAWRAVDSGEDTARADA